MLLVVSRIGDRRKRESSTMESIRKKLPRRQSTLSDADLDFIVANTSNSDKDMLRKQGDGSFISFNGHKPHICLICKENSYIQGDRSEW